MTAFIKAQLHYQGVALEIEAIPGQLGSALESARMAVDNFYQAEPDKSPEEDEGRARDNMLPAYQSHKQVKAAKIDGFTVLEDGRAKLLLYVPSADTASVSARTKTLITRPEWTERFRGSDSDFGYYVEYEDGFTSWSPSEAFESGYTRIA